MLLCDKFLCFKTHTLCICCVRQLITKYDYYYTTTTTTNTTTGDGGGGADDGGMSCVLSLFIENIQSVAHKSKNK